MPASFLRAQTGYMVTGNDVAENYSGQFPNGTRTGDLVVGFVNGIYESTWTAPSQFTKWTNHSNGPTGIIYAIADRDVSGGDYMTATPGSLGGGRAGGGSTLYIAFANVNAPPTSLAAGGGPTGSGGTQAAGNIHAPTQTAGAGFWQLLALFARTGSGPVTMPSGMTVVRHILNEGALGAVKYSASHLRVGAGATGDRYAYSEAEYSSWGYSLLLQEKNTAPNTPTGLAASNGGNASSTFSATATDPDGDNIQILFRYSTDANFGTYTDVFSTSMVSGGTATVSVSGLTNNTTYYVRASAYDGTVYSGYSQVSFTTNRPPVVPTLTGPANGSTLATRTPTLSATATDPDGNNWFAYFQVATDSAFTNVVFQGSGSTVASGGSSTGATSTLNPHQLYYWRAYSSDGTNTSGYSSAFTFTTPNTAPTAPTLGTPAAGAAVSLLGGGSFTWTHNDTDGDAQISYAFRRTDSSNAITYWNGTDFVTTETYVTSGTQSVTFPSGKWGIGTYTWTVSTKDNFGGTSPYATARTVISVGGLAMIV